MKCLTIVLAWFSLSTALDLIGSYQGTAEWYEFLVDESMPLGGDIIFYNQTNVIDILEQNGKFIRGKEYWLNSKSERVYVCDVFGIFSMISHSSGVWKVKIEEYFNKVDIEGSHEQMETLGRFDGTYDEKNLEFTLDYTGRTLSNQKFGAQHFTATRI
mmetsp:Transcript_24507/g.36049  ORF Transcript_24507/g.36049 Transcript_24507/m.36049 type:complete len:158 (+) Transcript_24507:51-524(+)|eukprot:CAMPEP_0185018312 /NCGR_PEP_ID=MMETSP1103-20130426/1076_1 /TAXON_ID=36769 /ORGANISM="Paraphysomonas bandaiensis, Strain Caron Lab Isolate" /LENGTH=157 /DNA_ID=CAMNT_0027548077 /DNA_START=11 /DNA_END=484 /DNA_ORIENTATION=+